MNNIRGTGPANPISRGKRDILRDEYRLLHTVYSKDTEVRLPGGGSFREPINIEAFLTTEAWELFRDFEKRILDAAQDSISSFVALPAFNRQAMSLLKMSMLLAASRQEPVANTVTVLPQDVKTAAWYVQSWSKYMIDMLMNVGQTASERRLSNVLQIIQKKPGVYRSYIMQTQHISRYEADNIFGTLSDRGQIISKKAGKGYQYWLS